MYFEIIKTRENYTTAECIQLIELSAGSAVSFKVPAHLLRLFKFQTFNFYILTLFISLWNGNNKLYKIIENDLISNNGPLHFVAKHFLTYIGLLQLVANLFLTYIGLLHFVAKHFLSYFGLLHFIAKHFFSYIGSLQLVAKHFLSYFGLLHSVAKHFINQYRKVFIALSAYKALINSMLNKLKEFYHCLYQLFNDIFIRQINKKICTKLYLNFAKKYCNSIISPFLSMAALSYLNEEHGCLVILQSSVNNFFSLKNLINYV